jgi:hypothetical protein
MRQSLGNSFGFRTYYVGFLVAIFEALKGDLESRRSIDTSVRGRESRFLRETDTLYSMRTPSLAVMIV